MNPAWYDAPEFQQFPIFCRLWLLWCKKGPGRREYGTVGGNLFLKCLSSYYRAFPSGQDNLVPITFSQIETDVFMDIVDKETYQHSVPVLSNGSTEIDLLKILLEVGDTFIDVGANIGTLSFYGAKLVGKNGRVVAVEPQPRLAEALRMTKIHNKLDQLDVIEAAAGVSDGQVEFYPSASSSGAASLRHDALTQNARFLVQMTSIDELAVELRIEDIRVLKVDVEGAELNVFRGTRKTLRAFAPFITFEINPSLLAAAGLWYSDVIKFLQSLSYEKFYDVSSVVSGSLIEIGEVNGLINVLAVHSTRVSELNQKLAHFNLPARVRA